MTTETLRLNRGKRVSTKASGGRARKKSMGPIYGLLPLVIVLALWQALGTDDSVYAPRPSVWWDAIAKLWVTGQLQQSLLDTLLTFLLSLIVATIVGTILGVIVGRSAFMDRLLGPVLEFFRVMPASAVVPFAVLMAGYTQGMKVGVVVFAGIWPILLQTRMGARTLEPLLIEVGRALHVSPFGRLRKMLLPAMMPSILQGIRLAVPTILIIVLLVEILTRINGLGGLIEESQQNYLSAAVYGLLLLSGIIALVVNTAVAWFDGWLMRNRPA